MKSFVVALMLLEVILFVIFMGTNFIANLHYIKFKKILRSTGSEVIGDWVTQGPRFDVFAAPVRIYIYLLMRSYRKETNSELQRAGKLCFIDFMAFILQIIIMIVIGVAVVFLNRK